MAPGGAAYVGWERNRAASGQSTGDNSVYIHMARVPAGAMPVPTGGPAHPVVVSLGQPHGTPSGGTKSLAAAGISGYTGRANDFPRVALDLVAGKVLVAWNDASRHPLRDVWLRALPMSLATLGRTVRVNDDSSYALHALPALSVRQDGTICSSWYDRRRSGATSTRTDYYGECRRNPTAPAADFRITTGATSWAGTASSRIYPNFGDYTDSATDGRTTYSAWSDGRVGVPQPFLDRR